MRSNGWDGRRWFTVLQGSTYLGQWLGKTPEESLHAYLQSHPDASGRFMVTYVPCVAFPDGVRESFEV